MIVVEQVTILSNVMIISRNFTDLSETVSTSFLLFLIHYSFGRKRQNYTISHTCRELPNTSNAPLQLKSTIFSNADSGIRSGMSAASGDHLRLPATFFGGVRNQKRLKTGLAMIVVTTYPCVQRRHVTLNKKSKDYCKADS